MLTILTKKYLFPNNKTKILLLQYYFRYEGEYIHYKPCIS